METKIKISAALLLFMIVLVRASELQEDRVCPEFCRIDIDYLVCNEGGTPVKTYPDCINCCQAGPGCTLYYKDGTSEVCT